MQRLIFATLVVLFSVIWSSAFVVGAIVLKEMDPWTLLALRFTLVVALLLPFCMVSPAFLDVKVVQHGLALGLLNNVLYLGLSFSALRTVRPEVVIVVISCAPFVTTLIARWWSVEPMAFKTLAGIALGFLGVVLISGIASTQQTPDLGGLGLAAAGMLAFAAGTVVFRRHVAALPVLPTNFWQSVAAAIALIPLAVIWGQPLHAPSMATVLGMLYLVFVATIGGMTLWLILIRTSGAATAASYHLLNPLCGLLLAYWVLGQALHLADVIGAGCIAVGLFLTMQAVEGRKP